VRKYRVLAKGNTNSVVMVTEPASDRGQILLMKGRDLWVFMPEVSQPIRLALSQRLTGQVANGDLARANFAGDYNPKLLRSEKVGNDDYHVLELTGIDRSVTYQKVIYWVREKDFWPHKAEFYSLSNRLLKTCSYENFKTHGRPKAANPTGHGRRLARGRAVGPRVWRHEAARSARQDVHQGLSQETRLRRQNTGRRLEDRAATALPNPSHLPPRGGEYPSHFVVPCHVGAAAGRTAAEQQKGGECFYRI
jgi:hypothetical protein